MLGWLVYEHGIELHVTVFDKSTRQDGTFSRDDFIYDHAGDVYCCPGGKMLTTTSSPVDDEATLRYRASKYDCQACRLKPRCCPKESARYVPRSIYEGARDMARGIAKSWERRVDHSGVPLLCNYYYRSRFAEELFNHRAGRDGVSWGQHTFAV